MSRRILQFFACMLLYLPVVAVSRDEPPPRTPQQRQEDSPSTRSDSAYHLEAGSSTLREIGGERVLELRDGVENAGV
jgi:hypothetical protein